MWKIGALKSNSEFELNGSFILPKNFSEDEEIDIIINSSFVIQRYLISGAYIDSIRFRDNTHPVDLTTGTK